MSFAGDGGNGGGGGNPAQQQSRVNFDTSSYGGGQRDPWNRPIKQAQNDQNNQRSGNDQNNQNQTDDNAGIDDNLIASIWDKVENTDQQQQQQQGNQPQNNQQPDPAKQMKDYLQSVGLSDEFVISEQEKEAMQGGDFSGVMTRVNQLIVNAHTKALSSADKLIDAKIAAASAKVKDQSVSYMMGQQNLQSLNTALPWTKEKHIAPMAQSVMQKFLDKGMSTDKAIDGVRRYFEDINTRMNGGNRNRSQNFSAGNTEQEKANNWVALLSPDN